MPDHEELEQLITERIDNEQEKKEGGKQDG